MLYHLLTSLSDEYTFLNVFSYLTFRTGIALFTAFVVSFLFGPKVIFMLKAKQKKGQPIRDDGPESHILTKQGTPTMGGFLILLGLSASTLLWADLSNHYVWACLLVTTGFGFIGFLDDYAKITQSSTAGVSGRMKLLMELLVSFGAVYIIMGATAPEISSQLALPFVKDFMVDLGWFMIPFAMFVLVGASNSVNLTDGLDGLAIGTIAIAVSTLSVMIAKELGWESSTTFEKLSLGAMLIDIGLKQIPYEIVSKSLNEMTPEEVHFYETHPFRGMELAIRAGSIPDDIILEVNSIPGATYNWTGPNGFMATTNDPVLTGVTPMDAGEYFIEVSKDGCDAAMLSTEVFVIENPDFLGLKVPKGVFSSTFIFFFKF